MKKLEREFIIKFGDKKWIDKLQSGELFMQPLKYYRELEEKQMKKGQGDKYDGVLRIDLNGFKLREINDCENKMEIDFRNLGGKMTLELKLNGDEKYLTSCFYGVNNERFSLSHEDKENFYYKYNFTKEEIDTFYEWGDTALIIDKNYFLSIIENTFKDVDIRYKSINYYEQSRPPIELIVDYQKGNIDRLFWKHSFFSNQSEFRVMCAKQSENGEVAANFDDISRISCSYSAKKLLNEGFIIILKKKVIKLEDTI